MICINELLRNRIPKRGEMWVAKGCTEQWYIVALKDNTVYFTTNALTYLNSDRHRCVTRDLDSFTQWYCYSSTVK